MITYACRGFSSYMKIHSDAAQMTLLGRKFRCLTHCLAGLLVCSVFLIIVVRAGGLKVKMCANKACNGADNLTRHFNVS